MDERTWVGLRESAGLLAAAATSFQRVGRCSTCAFLLLHPSGQGYCKLFEESLEEEATGECRGWEDENG